MDERVTVPLSTALKAFVAECAAEEDRSEASVVRRLIAEAAARRERSRRSAARDVEREAAA
jgi:hypothetical protein